MAATEQCRRQGTVRAFRDAVVTRSSTPREQRRRGFVQGSYRIRAGPGQGCDIDVAKAFVALVT